MPLGKVDKKLGSTIVKLGTTELCIAFAAARLGFTGPIHMGPAIYTVSFRELAASELFCPWCAVSGGIGNGVLCVGITIGGTGTRKRRFGGVAGSLH